MQLLTIIAMIFAAGGVMFALQNNVPVTVTFAIWRFDSTLAMILLLALAAGGLIVALVSTPSTLRRQWAMSRQSKRIAELENTSSRQQQTIADLERRIPADAPPAAVERPYVGLKQIMVGSDAKEEPVPPA